MILVVAEQREGKLNRASWEAVAAAQQLAAGMPIKILVLGGATGSVPTDLAAAAVAEVLVAGHAPLEPFTPDAAVMALQGIIETQQPPLAAMGPSYLTTYFAPR